MDTSADDSFDGNSLVLEQADGTGLSLREAIGLANQNAGAPGSGDDDGDTITFSSVAFLLSQTVTLGSSIEVTDDVLIDGTFLLGGLPVKIVIDAAGSDRILRVDTSAAAGVNSTVALSQIVLANGATAGDGGGILVAAGSSIELRSGSEITSCRAEDGGGIYSEGRARLDGVSLSGNAANGAAGSGGGIFNAAGASLVVANSEFTENLANRAGGAIEDQAGAGQTTVIGATIFTGNNAGVAPATAAPGNGGAIHITGASDMEITGGSATANLAAREGGALWNGSGKMTVNGTQIGENRASGAAADDGGGGIFNNGGTLEIVDAVIRGNIADGGSGSGGGLFSTAGSVAISGSTVIAANLANRAGGGIEVVDGSLKLDGVQLGGAAVADGNIAGPAGTANPGNGGGLHVSGTCEVTVSGGRVAFNSAAREGGGLWNQMGATMTIDGGATIANNIGSGPAADDGGGGVFNNGGAVVIDGSASPVTIADNVADGAAGSGGGILTAGGTLEIIGATISGNLANRAGGGIEARDLAVLTAIVIADSTLSGNSAGVAPATAAPGNGGGVHITGGGGVWIGGSMVSGNVAAAEGGGLWNGSGSMVVEDSTLDSNVASGADLTNGGGGIFNAGGTVTLSNGVTLSNNIADGAAGSGGGIFNDVGGLLEVSDSKLEGNLANRAGGGIEDNSGAGLGVTLSGVEFTGNNAGFPPAVASPGNGGAVHISGAGDITITGGSASMNVAAREGGAYWNGAGTMTIDGGSIDANTGAGPAADDGGGGIFNNGGSVVVQNGTVISNNVASGAGGSGGGILNLGALSLDGVRLESNLANRAGGGLEDASGAATAVSVKDSEFVGNNAGVAPAVAAPGNGGAIHVGGDGNIDISGGGARANLAAAEGGAFWIGTGTMTIDGVTADANIASGAAADEGGGACFIAGGTLTIVDSMFTNNIADGVSGSGGGIFNDVGGSLTVTNSMFGGNVANRAGGGIEDNSGAGLGVVLSGVGFSGNNAGVAPAVANPGNGGAVHISGAGDITITGGSASMNLAAREGGAYWNGGGTMEIDGGSVADNRASGAAADEGGGGLFNQAGTLIVDGGASITGNLADGSSGSGGGIFNNTGARLSVSGATISGNVANRAGGGIEDNAGASVEISDSRLSSNTAGPAGSAAPGNGGAFHVSGAGTISIDRCHIDANDAANEGGGLWNSGAATMSVSACAITNSSAADGGGLFQQAGAGTLQVVNSTISGNGASNGGGLQTEGGVTDLLNTTLASNSATTGGGANVAAGSLTLINSAIADNSAASGADLNGAIATASNSLLEDVSGSTGISDGIDGNLVGVDPQLGSLADNGGPTPSHLPTSDSPLVDAGDNTAIAGFPNDQRGSGFARIINSQVDIGAIEVFVLSYSGWAAANFTAATPVDQRDPDDNPDGDARSNALEYLTGSDPEDGLDGSPVEVSLEAGQLAFTFDRVKSIPAGTEVLEQSGDLTEWMPIVTPDRSSQSQSATVEVVTLSIDPSMADRLFGRIRVSVPE